MKRLGVSGIYLRRMTGVAAIAVSLACQAAEEPQLGACAVSAISGFPVLAGTKLDELECLSSLGVEVTPGEYEPASIVLRSSAAIRDLTVTVSDLRGSSATIDHSFVDIKYVKVWYQSGTGWKSIKNSSPGRILVPELLLNDDSLIRVDIEARKNYLRLSNGTYLDISSGGAQLDSRDLDVGVLGVTDSPSQQRLQLPANHSKQIWFTVHAPIDASPGIYHGLVTIESPSSAIRMAIPIIVRVLPFRLSQPVIEYAIYYRGQLDRAGRGAISSELKSRQQLRADFVNMRQHGIANPTIYQESGGKAAFQELLEIRREAGLSNERLYHLGINSGNYSSPSAMNIQYARLAALQEVARSTGVREFFVYGVDEAEPDAIGAQRDVWSAFQRLGAKVFVAAYEFGEAEKQYAGRIDMLVLGVRPARAPIDLLQSRGTRVFLYNQPQVGVENPAVYRLNYGINAWALGFNGVMNYAYQHAMGSIWNDFDHPQFRDHVFAYPTSNGVIDTIAWEGFREAVDDVRYLSTLIDLNRQKPSEEVKEFLNGLQRSGVRDPEIARKRIVSLILSICSVRQNPSESHRICLW